MSSAYNMTWLSGWQIGCDDTFQIPHVGGGSAVFPHRWNISQIPNWHGGVRAIRGPPPLQPMTTACVAGLHHISSLYFHDTGKGYVTILSPSPCCCSMQFPLLCHAVKETVLQLAYLCITIISFLFLNLYLLQGILQACYQCIIDNLRKKITFRKTIYYYVYGAMCYSVFF